LGSDCNGAKELGCCAAGHWEIFVAEGESLFLGRAPMSRKADDAVNRAFVKKMCIEPLSEYVRTASVVETIVTKLSNTTHLSRSVIPPAVFNLG
jgi:hypothetical protein